MSRFREGENDDEFWMLDHGRWERNARATLKGRRGRKALAEIREALLALPEKRLIEGALCTVGGPDRVPEVTGADVDALVQDLKEKRYWHESDTREEKAESLRSGRAGERAAVAKSVSEQGPGVCLNGALLWHRLVKGGMSPDLAFAELPSVTGELDDDPLYSTAKIAEREAGIALTLAWQLAYRNDETYKRMTPEERYTAFLAWIDAELAETTAA